MTEDKMVGWHHQLNGHEFEQALGDGEGLRSLACCSPAAAAKSLQSCLTLCDPRDCSLPGSSIHGILQARTLQWVAIAFSAVYSEAGTYVGIWTVKRNLIYDSLENFAMQEGEYNLRD